MRGGAGAYWPLSYASGGGVPPPVTALPHEAQRASS
jgi:hypothetical protein